MLRHGVSAPPAGRVRVQTARSVPRANTSMRPSAVPLMAGDEVSAPPQLVQLPQVPLRIIRSHSALSVPRAATTTVVRATAAAGAPAMTPPTRLCGDQAGPLPLKVRRYTALSAPR